MSLRDRLEKVEQSTESPINEELPEIIYNQRELLSKDCETATMDEAIKIWAVLEAVLNKYHPKDGVGLSANQIGINKKVSIIKYGGETYKLLNPRIVSYSENTDAIFEGCLSFPGQVKRTVRATDIVVEDDNIGKIGLSAQTDGFLPVIFQHEIDHLYGKTMFDRVQEPRKTVTIGRNDPCPCGSGKKYKKCCLKT